MKQVKKTIFSLLILFILSAMEIALAGGPPPGPPGGGGPPCWPPPCAAIPLDGGLSLILAAGIAYGGRKIYKYTKKNPD